MLRMKIDNESATVPIMIIDMNEVFNAMTIGDPLEFNSEETWELDEDDEESEEEEEEL